MLIKQMGIFALGTGLLLAGCGGGDDTTARVPLSAANYSDIASSVAASVVGSGSIVSTFESVASADPSAPAPTGIKALNTGRMGDLARFALNRLSIGQPVLERPAAVSQETSVCDSGGTLDVRFNDADNNEEGSAGDSVSVTANNCVVEAGLPAVNGALDIRLLAVGYGSDGSVVSATADLTFGSFRSAGLVLNGGGTLSFDPTMFSLAHKNLSSSYGGQTLVYNHTLTVQTQVSPATATVGGRFSVNGSQYTVSTPLTLQLGAAYPAAGTLRIADGLGNRVDVVMFSTGFDADLYLAGDDVRDGRSSTAWSAL